ncbi:MAG: hypothetical protein CMB28_05560 [Euryarchaeota archaeon]|nr:hypothetical protein [Euryarchaeota archaeon]
MKNNEEDSSDSNFESTENEEKMNQKPEPILIDANGSKSKPEQKVPTNTVKQPLTRPQKALKGFLLIAIGIVSAFIAGDTDESFWIFCSASIFLFVYGWSTILQAMTTTKDMSNKEAIGTTVIVFGLVIFAFIAWIIHILSQGF